MSANGVYRFRNSGVFPFLNHMSAVKPGDGRKTRRLVGSARSIFEDGWPKDMSTNKLPLGITSGPNDLNNTYSNTNSLRRNVSKSSHKPFRNQKQRRPKTFELQLTFCTEAIIWFVLLWVAE
eukprot:2745591-Amphidinium_carterae.1